MGFEYLVTDLHGIIYFLQRELYTAVAVIEWCMRVCMCSTKPDQCAGKQIFRMGVVLDGEEQKCPNAVHDLDLENEVIVWQSRNINWPYLGHFSKQNQNAYCSEISS